MSQLWRLIGSLEETQRGLGRRLDDTARAARRDLALVRRELLGRVALLERSRPAGKPWWLHLLGMALLGGASLLGIMKPETITLLRALLRE